MEPGALQFYCQLLNDELSDFTAQIQLLRTRPLPVYFDKWLTVRIIDPAVKLVLRLLGMPNGDIHYAFASKFLHWVAELPPFDQRVGRALNALTGHNPTPPPHPNYDQVAASYTYLIQFYNECLKDLESQHHGQNLIELDFLTQPPHLRRRNNAVRIIDKYLWISGA
jgi:hypothetical protein